MAYVRSKLINGYGPYYYLVEGNRDERGLVKQRVLKYLGRNAEPGPVSPREENRMRGEEPAPTRSVESKATPEPIKVARVEAKREISKEEEHAQDALNKAEAEREIIGRSEVDDRKKKAAEERRTKEAAEKVRDSLKTAQKSLDDYHKEEVEASGRSKSKWSRERKRQAAEVSKTVGCSTIQADAMIQRAKRSGKSYDEVDWDQAQGRDLTYSERVDKLDTAIGTHTRTKGELSHSSKDVDDLISKWEQDPETYQGELESAMSALNYDMKAEVY